MRSRWRSLALAILVLEVAGLNVAYGGPPGAAAAGPEMLHPPTPQPVAAPPLPGACADPQSALAGPIFSEGLSPRLPPVQPCAWDQPLPINLATALRLADARPLVIAAAQASVKVAVAQLAEARVLWLPNVYLGISYLRHDGGGAGNSGEEFINGRDQFMAGGGLLAAVSSNDAIFGPLALKQVLRAREIDVQTARNDALLTVAEAYFNVQQALGRLAGALDAVDKARELARTVESLGKALVPPIEADRVRAQLAESEQAAAAARREWRVASADLTRALRLNPAAVVVPLEPPYLLVTLLAPGQPVDSLIAIGLTHRPELASQQALVQATLTRLRQERLRPLMPSLLLQGDATPAAPGGYLMGGLFGTDVSGQGQPWSGRNDVNVQLLWEFRNLGFGNRALVHERRAEQERAVIELFRIQDQVAAEVAQAYADLESATVRVSEAETGLQESQITYGGSLKGLSQTTRFGDVLILVSRPQEAVAALRQLARAYDAYFLSVNDYNRAQFRLIRALGYPAGILACERSPGQIEPVDTTRPPQMAPVCAPEPCQCRP